MQRSTFVYAKCATKVGIVVVSCLAIVLTGCGTKSDGAQSAPDPQVQVEAASIVKDASPSKALVYSFLAEGTIEDADSILAGSWPVDRYEQADLGAIPTWHEDPFQAAYWRFIFYSLRPMRNLAFAWNATQDPKYIEAIKDILDSFTTEARAAEFPIDAHEIAFRIMMITYLRDLLASNERLSAELDGKIGIEITADVNTLEISQYYNVGSNHGLTEAAAIALAGETYSNNPEASAWKQLGYERMDEVLETIVDADGVEIENSPFYHFYVLRFALEISEWATRNGHAMDAVFAERISSMVKFATWITEPDGQIPLIGASVQMDVRRVSPDVFDQLEAQYPEFAYVRSGGVDGAPPKAGTMLFPTSGLAILRPRFSEATNFVEDSQVLMDTGAWRTDHSQADALSVVAYAFGQTYLPDSGLFNYDEEGDSYFNSTEAHNTVVVDGADQSINGPVTPGLSADGNAPTAWAYQSGSHELYAGVKHDRAVLTTDDGRLVVIDHLVSSATHDYQQIWHMSPGIRTAATSAGAAMAVDEAEEPAIAFSNAQGSEVEQGFGKTTPLLSWYSEQYEKKSDTAAVAFRQTSTNAWFVTAIGLGANQAKAITTTATTTSTGAIALVCSTSGNLKVVIQNLARGADGGETVAVDSAPSC